MVVVYSGERDRPDRWWDDRETPNYPASLDSDTPVPPEPTLSARDLRPPPAARFPEMVPPAPDLTTDASSELEGSGANLTSLPEPAPLASTEAPVALSSPASAGAASAAAIDVASAHSERSPVGASNDGRAAWFQKGTPRRAAVVVVGAFLGAYIAAHKPAEPASGPAEKTVAASANEVVEPRMPAAAPAQPAAESPALVAPPAPEPVEGVPAAVTPQPSEPAPVEVEAPVASSASVAPKAKPVVIEVVPYDAKVMVHGITQPGPPFVVSVPNGKRVVCEVVRKGYAPRRVVLDGSDAKLTIGLLRNRGARGAEVGETPPETEPVEPGKDSRLRVRSGL